MYLETTGYNLTPIVYLQELYGPKITYAFREHLDMNVLSRDVIQNQIYLLQEAIGVNFGLNFGFGLNLHSKQLDALINEASDPHYPETHRFLEMVNLDAAGVSMLVTFRRLTEPPENWTGDCQPVWLKGEASLLYLSKQEPQMPVYETFAERVLSRMANTMPGIPKP